VRRERWDVKSSLPIIKKQDPRRQIPKQFSILFSKFFLW
jgi:hypothetical protein